MVPPHRRRPPRLADHRAVHAGLVVGTLAGKRLADRLSGRTLGLAFAWLLIAVGLFVGIQNLLPASDLISDAADPPGQAGLAAEHGAAPRCQRIDRRTHASSASAGRAPT